MWVFTNDAMISVVEHREDRRVLVVRARLKGDLKRFFGKKMLVMETPTGDYRWRCYVSRSRLKQAMIRALEKIDYPNFKSSVRDNDRHLAYMDVWSAMLRAQTHENPRPRFGRDALLSLFGGRAAFGGGTLPQYDRLVDHNRSAIALATTVDSAERSRLEEETERRERDDMAVEIENVMANYGYRLETSIDTLFEDGDIAAL